MTINKEPEIIIVIEEGPVDALALAWPIDCGAEVVFLGRTRSETHPEFGDLLHLDYEIFAPMAMKLLTDMAKQTAQRWDCHAVRIAHSKGIVKPSEASTIIQVATPHRSEAFEACRYLIDRLKHELPIWKKEIWERGQTYVQGCCAHHPDDRKLGLPPALPTTQVPTSDPHHCADHDHQSSSL